MRGIISAASSKLVAGAKRAGRAARTGLVKVICWMRRPRRQSSRRGKSAEDKGQPRFCVLPLSLRRNDKTTCNVVRNAVLGTKVYGTDVREEEILSLR